METIRSICAVLLVLTCLPIAQGQPQTWRKFQSEHFELYTASGESAARQVLPHLERLRVAYEFLTGSKTTGTDRARVVLFRDKREYQPYAMQGYSDAYYMNGWGRDHIVLSDLGTDWERVLNHEYFHLFSRHAGFRMPVWLEEGLADYYSTMRITAQDVSVGQPVENHLKFLNSWAGRPVPLANIFAITRSGRHLADLRATLLLYAQAWALVHMTFMDADFRPKANEFFRALKDGGNSQDAYQKVYGLSANELDTQFARYITRSRYAYTKQKTEGLAIPVEVREKPTEDWETPLLLADLQALAQRPDQAAKTYRELAGRFPHVAEVDASQGYLALLEMNRSAAAGHFRGAAAKGSRNARIYQHLVQLQCNYLAYDRQCHEWIDEVLSLDPGNREARRWATGYVLNARMFEDALQYMQYMAHAGGVPAAEAPEFFYRFAYAQANLGRTDEARAAIRRGLEFASQPAEAARLRELAKLVEESAAYSERVERLRPGVPAMPAPAPGEPLQTQARNAGHDQRESAADRALTSFMEREGAQVVTGVVNRIDCRGGSLLVDVPSGLPLRLKISDIRRVQVFSGGVAFPDPAAACDLPPGKQALVAYTSGSALPREDPALELLLLP